MVNCITFIDYALMFINCELSTHQSLLWRRKRFDIYVPTGPYRDEEGSTFMSR
jgi:hypothetical protein